MRTRLACFGGRLARAVALIGLFGALTTGTAPGQETPRPVDPAPLARYFPRKDLVGYAEFDGLDAHRDAWKKTAAYRLLSETTTGAMLEQSVARLLDLIPLRQSGTPVGGRELVALGVHLLHSGFAVGFNREGGVGAPRCLGVVIRGAARGKNRSIIERLLGAGEHASARVKQVEKPNKRTIHVWSDSLQRTLAWWSEGDDLVVSMISPAGADAIIAALEGREPSAVEHPTRTALLNCDDERGFEPVGLAFFDMAALPPLPKQAIALGLDRVKRFDYRWGFHGQALESIIGVVAPSPRTGIPALFDQPAFDARHLPPLPGGLAGFTVFSLDTARLFDQIVASLKVIGPGGPDASSQFQQTVQQTTGLQLRDDLLAHLGSRVVLYTVPTRVNAPTNPLAGLAQGLVFVPKFAVVIEVKNQEAVAKALDTLAKRVNRGMRVLADQVGGGEVGEFKRLKGEDNGRVLSLPTSILPMAAGLRPTLLLGSKAMVLATTPTTARRALDRNERSEALGLPPGDPLAVALQQLPDRLVFLTIDDTRQSMFPELLVSLPNLIEFGIRRGVHGVFNPPRAAPEEPSQRPGRTLAMDPELIPDPESLRPFLFPSVHALTVDDQGIRLISREAFPTFNPATAAPVALAMLVPAVGMAMQRTRSTNNLKQIGLALHNFHDIHNRFPADLHDKDGKPLVSWRVRLLPYLDQEALYNEFHLDEPWDSPHNKALLERMPAVFADPNTPAEPGMTFYRGFSGEHAFLDPKVPEGVPIASITDGTSNTIAVVEAREAVPWTKPDNDIPFEGDPTKPDKLRALRAGLGGHFSGGFHALLVDGSVRFIRDSINLNVLHALVTRDGGEVISTDSY